MSNLKLGTKHNYSLVYYCEVGGWWRFTECTIAICAQCIGTTITPVLSYHCKSSDTALHVPTSSLPIIILNIWLFINFKLYKGLWKQKHINSFFMSQNQNLTFLLWTHYQRWRSFFVVVVAVVLFKEFKQLKM